MTSQPNHTRTFSNLGSLIRSPRVDGRQDPSQVLSGLSFGRVDAESDDRFDGCFIGTDLLRQVLLPEHSLLVGAKGSGKSALARLLCDNRERIKPLLPRGYEEVYCIPAHGLQSEEYLAGCGLRELQPESVDDFRSFWLLYLGLKAASTLVRDPRMREIVRQGKSDRARSNFAALERVVEGLGMLEEPGLAAKHRSRMAEWFSPAREVAPPVRPDAGGGASSSFRDRTGMTVISLLDCIDQLMQETNCLAWLMLDKLDLLFIGDIDKLKLSITGLVHLLVEYSTRFRNIHLKLFLRTDIFRNLHIVNKSHLVSYTTYMKWPGRLLLKMLVSRAVANPAVQAYCEKALGEKIDITNVIIGDDAYVLKLFYLIFEPQSGNAGSDGSPTPSTHEWILKRLVDGMGTGFPRELIHLGNLSAAKQREFNRLDGAPPAAGLIGLRALKEAFAEVSAYRCDTYLYSEFPHLARHFDLFRGGDSSLFTRQELHEMFRDLDPKGDDAVRAVYDAGLLAPAGKNVDSSREFRVPLLYRKGLGITDRRARKRSGPPSQGDSEARLHVLR